MGSRLIGLTPFFRACFALKLRGREGDLREDRCLDEGGTLSPKLNPSSLKGPAATISPTSPVGLGFRV